MSVNPHSYTAKELGEMETAWLAQEALLPPTKTLGLLEAIEASFKSGYLAAMLASKRLDGPKDEALEGVKKLRMALTLCDRYCDHLHHEKKHQHKAGEPCPVEKVIHDALDSTDSLFATHSPQEKS